MKKNIFLYFSIFIIGLSILLSCSGNKTKLNYKLVQIDYYNSQGYSYTVDEFEYNEDGYHLKAIGKDSFESTVQIDYTYDSNNNLIETYMYDDANYNYAISYTYDENSRLIKEKYHSSNQYNYVLDEFTYDASGNPIKGKGIDVFEDEVTKSYSYDENDNLIQIELNDHKEYYEITNYSYEEN